MVTITMVPRAPPNTFNFVRPGHYHGIITHLPLPVIDQPFEVLHPVSTYRALLVDLERLSSIPGVNAEHVAPIRAFIRVCIERGPDNLPDVQLYDAHPLAVSSANLANVYFVHWARMEPQVRKCSYCGSIGC